MHQASYKTDPYVRPSAGRKRQYCVTKGRYWQAEPLRGRRQTPRQLRASVEVRKRVGREVRPNLDTYRPLVDQTACLSHRHHLRRQRTKQNFDLTRSSTKGDVNGAPSTFSRNDGNEST